MANEPRRESGRFARDPIGSWFDKPAATWARAAYRDFGRPVDVYLAPPTGEQRARARRLGINVDAPDPNGTEPNMWVRVAKRATYRMVRLHGFAREFRPSRERLDLSTMAVLVQWQTVGLTVRPGGIRAWHIRLTVEPKKPQTRNGRTG